ncbi:MAG: serine O-acetyltransferase [Desulfuromonadales bacterium]|nr:serine O-acetyltransferase [Desulfuromonadales bacterium]
MLKSAIKRIREDIETVFNKDPAARSIWEVLFCYPGLHAIWLYRLANKLWRWKLYFAARLISHLGRFLTGIEIHPGAKIGRRFFIDHGSGVVIGETSEIADDVLMYQGVVLGGVSLQKEKRHPTIGNNVLIGAGTIILGPIYIGDGVRIGAASLVLHDVPANAVAVGVPARVGLGFTSKDIEELGHNKLPDPIAEAFRFLGNQVVTLEKRLEDLEQLQGIKVGLDKYLEEKKRGVLSVFNEAEEFTRGTGI